MKATHNFVFPNRLNSMRRYNDESFWYLRHPSNDERVKKHYACPCCVAHFDDLNALSNHFRADHEEYLPRRQQQQSEPSISGSSSLSEQHDQGHNPTSLADYQQEQSAEAIGQKRSHDELLSLDGITFDPPHGEHLLVNNFDVSDAVYMMQLSLKHYKWKLSLEDHLHLALASTSILLLSPNRYPDEVKPFFEHNDWTAAIDFIQDMYSIKKQPMPLNTVTSMLAIIDNLLAKTINREQAEANLKSLSLSSHEHKFAKALSALITKLPPVPMEEDVNESELCTRFLDPFLSALFDDPDNGVYLRWTNETTLETKMQSDLSKHRPDLCITKSCGVKWDASRGYGEAKPATQGQDHYLVCKDLHKVRCVLQKFSRQSVHGRHSGHPNRWANYQILRVDLACHQSVCAPSTRRDQGS